jgi:hypothetical protein
MFKPIGETVLFGGKKVSLTEAPKPAAPSEVLFAPIKPSDSLFGQQVQAPQA